MESKYYIPDITEFREGFEYELKMDSNWYPMSSPFYPLVNNFVVLYVLHTFKLYIFSFST